MLHASASSRPRPPRPEQPLRPAESLRDDDGFPVVRGRRRSVELVPERERLADPPAERVIVRTGEDAVGGEAIRRLIGGNPAGGHDRIVTARCAAACATIAARRGPERTKQAVAAAMAPRSPPADCPAAFCEGRCGDAD